MANVLVTRPADDAARTAEILRTLGHEPVVSPVLRVRTLAVEFPRRRWQAALFTSRNAAIRSDPDAIGRDTLCLAVGTATAEAVRARGFHNVLVAKGNAGSVARLASDRLRPDGGPLVHPCGVHRTPGLVQQLEAGGYDVVLAPCYDTVAAPLTQRARAMLAADEIDVALLYSARSARAFADAVEGLDLGAVALLTMSAAVADALPAILRKLVRWPARPSEADIVACLPGPRDMR